MMTDVPNAGTLSLMLDVDVAALKSGANTVEFTTTNASPPLIPVVSKSISSSTEARRR